MNIGVVATAIMKGTEKPQNSVFVIDKNGNIQMNCSKVHVPNDCGSMKLCW